MVLLAGLIAPVTGRLLEMAKQWGKVLAKVKLKLVVENVVTSEETLWRLIAT